MINSAIKTSDGIEVYANQVGILTDEYINNLPVPDMIYKNAACFNGLISHIYTHLFKPKKNDKILYNSRCRLDLSDTELLNDIWDLVYSPLCNNFGRIKTLSRFCLLIGISEDTMNTWRKGEYRNREYSCKSNLTHSELTQKWYEECKMDTVTKAIEENSVGAIFGAKSLFGVVEQNVVRVETSGAIPGKSLEQIAQQFAGAELPPPIDVE